MTATSAPAANECDATCRCRSVTPIANPCSCGMYEKGTRCPFCEVVAGGVTAKQPREQSKAEMLADFDARMSEAVAKVPKVNPRGQDAASTPLETPRPAKPRRKRRSREEMAEVRAEAADRIRRVRRRVTPDWLADQDAVEETFMEMMRHDQD